MPELLTSNTPLTCSFGAAPSVFTALPLPGKPVILGGLTTATIQEIAPIVNIPPFGVCSSMANPQVASATAAALGVLTPMPCVPVPTAPWAPPSALMTYASIPLATVQSKCFCAWGGVIGAQAPVEFIAMVQA